MVVAGDRSLLKRAFTGTAWVAVDRLLTLAVRFVVTLVLAWLLSPADFACVGILAVFVAVSTTLLDSGFGAALIRESDPSQTDYSSVFYWNLSVAVIMCLLLWLIAPAVGSWMSIPSLSSVMRGLSFGLIADALCLIPANRLRKLLAFRTLAIVNLASLAVGGGAAVGAAYMHFGVWALVVLQVVTSFVKAALLWVFARWLPSARFSAGALRTLFSYGGFMFAASMLQEICNNIQGVVIGRISPLQVGFFNQAEKLNQITSYTLPNILVQVLFPVYSSMASDLNRLASAVESNVRLVAFAVIPLLTALFVVSEPLIHFLYGTKWLPAVPYFRIFCIAGCFVCLQNINFYAVASAGFSRQLFWWSIYKWSVLLVLILFGSRWGAVGICWGMVISSLNIWLVNALLVSRYVGFRFSHQLRAVLPALGAAVFSFTLIIIIKWFCDSVSLWVLAVILLAIYLLIARLLQFRALDEVTSILSRL